MLTRLSRALLRVFPALLLVVVGLLAALFRRRSGRREGATMLVPVAAGRREPPVRWRGAAIAVLGLLIGIGLVLAVLDADGILRRLVSPVPSSDGQGMRPVAALSRADVDSGRRGTSEPAAPNGSNASAEQVGRGAAAGSGTSDTHPLSFDTVRVEPNGELVVAGRAPPNGTVELLVDGKATARVVADANGQFAIVPPALPAGNSEVALRVTDGKGFVRQSQDRVAVAVSPSHDTKPLVALTSPDKPTRVLSQPGSPQTGTRPVPDATSHRRTTTDTASPTQRGSGEVGVGDSAGSAAASGDVARSSRAGPDGNGDAGVLDRAAPAGTKSGPLVAPETPTSETPLTEGPEKRTKIVSVDAQGGGRLFVTGQAAAGATVRLYLNDTLIAPARVGRDGTVTFTIGRGVKSGDYKVRLDQVDTASGKVRSRVEVPFSVPDAARIAGTDRSLAAPSETSSRVDGDGKAGSNASPPMAASPETVARQGPTAGASDGPRASRSESPAPPSSETMRDPLKPQANPAVVFVPEIKTARIERGDSLWAISRRTYGEGDRYTAIYDANQDQIRDPDLIYPGQVFVLPSEDAIDAVQDDKRD